MSTACWPRSNRGACLNRITAGRRGGLRGPHLLRQIQRPNRHPHRDLFQDLCHSQHHPVLHRAHTVNRREDLKEGNPSQRYLGQRQIPAEEIAAIWVAANLTPFSFRPKVGCRCRLLVRAVSPDQHYRRRNTSRRSVMCYGKSASNATGRKKVRGDSLDPRSKTVRRGRG